MTAKQSALCVRIITVSLGSGETMVLVPSLPPSKESSEILKGEGEGKAKRVDSFEIF